jgi:hypothetical protein
MFAVLLKTAGRPTAANYFKSMAIAGLLARPARAILVLAPSERHHLTARTRPCRDPLTSGSRQNIPNAAVVPTDQVSLESGLPEHHCHWILHMGRSHVAERVDLPQRFNEPDFVRGSQSSHSL